MAGAAARGAALAGAAARAGALPADVLDVPPSRVSSWWTEVGVRRGALRAPKGARVWVAVSSWWMGVGVRRGLEVQGYLAPKKLPPP